MSQTDDILRHDQPLAPLTTLRVGGAARHYVEVDDPAALAGVLARARDQGWSLLPLGGGSNLLVADRGFDGLVLRHRDTALRIERRGGRARVHAGAGLSWDALAARCVAEGLAGVECLSGIPGDCGAAPIQNIGAYGQELAPVCVAVDAVELATGQARRFDAVECSFGYRDSRFKSAEPGRWLVTGVELELEAAGTPALRYEELRRRAREAFGEREPDLAGVRELVLGIRRGKAMVLEPGNPDATSAGSFFVNPVVDDAVADELGEGSGMPRYPAGEGHSKLSAAWLIERAGLSRGFTMGRAGLSTRHVLALTNRGGATAAELLALAVHVRQRVLEETGVALVPEPRLVGFTPEELAPLYAA